MSYNSTRHQVLGCQLTQKEKSPNYLTWSEQNQLTATNRWGGISPLWNNSRTYYLSFQSAPSGELSNEHMKYSWNQVAQSNILIYPHKTAELLLIFTPMPLCAVICSDNWILFHFVNLQIFEITCRAAVHVGQLRKHLNFKCFFFFFKLRFSGFLASVWFGFTWRQSLICISDGFHYTKRGQVIDSRMCADVLK